MEEIIIALMQRFEDKKSLFTNAGLNPIMHIDKMRGQPIDPASFELYELPALFYNWKIGWSKGGRKYVGAVTWEFSLQLDPTWDTSSISTSHIEGIMQVLYHTLTRKVLDDFETETSSKLLRIDEVPMDMEVTNYHKLQYSCNFYDPASSDAYIEVLIESLRLQGFLKETI
jgi:hypothetical protein